MGFTEAVKHVFRNYAVFQGRAGRAEFWWFFLFTVIVQWILQIPYQIGLSQIEGANMVWGTTPSGEVNALMIVGAALFFIWTAATIVPTISVTVRRLHDTDRSGWWWWLNFLCCIGWIILLVFELLPSTPGPNRFGDGPATA